MKNHSGAGSYKEVFLGDRLSHRSLMDGRDLFAIPCEALMLATTDGRIFA